METKEKAKTREVKANLKTVLRITVSEAINCGQFGLKKTGGWS